MTNIVHTATYRRYAAFCAAIFLVLAYCIHLNLFAQIDVASMAAIQAAVVRSADLPLSVVTLLGSSELTAVWLGIIFLFLWRKNRRASWTLFFIGLIFIVEIIGKQYLVHPRPPSSVNRYTLPFSLPSSTYAPVAYSFPSGHIARTTYVFVIVVYMIALSRLVYHQKMLYIVGAIVYTFVVIISRISLGAHWISDVIGGLLLGLSVGFFSISYWVLPENHSKRSDSHASTGSKSNIPL